ncbi:Hypothetical protein AA314_05198 [Archangium gephyra]|uniref:Uncharacterized protein n=1 Tax=Archangium gephyra TaxID=48 RepID=A0AAC8TF24_9BACT|nr:Hypothetical protein AA314_05198 [Archangium gephyra]
MTHRTHSNRPLAPARPPSRPRRLPVPAANRCSSRGLELYERRRGRRGVHGTRA